MSRANRSEKEAVQEAVQGETPNGAGWIRVTCPVCPSRGLSPDKKASLGFHDNSTGFRCFRCGVHGRVSSSSDHYKSPFIFKSSDRERSKQDWSWEDFVPIWSDTNWGAFSLQQARSYLQVDRGFSREDLMLWKVHVAVRGKYRGRVVLPHTYADGSWWGFSARLHLSKLLPGSIKVLYPPSMPPKIYNMEAWVEACGTSRGLCTLLMEGCLDTVGYPGAMASLGKPTLAHLDAISAVHRAGTNREAPLVLVLDGDAWEWGRACSEILRLRGVNASCLQLPPRTDPNDLDRSWVINSAYQQVEERSKR